MAMPLFDRTFGVIPALDAPSLDDVLRIVEVTSRVEGVVGYKLGLAGVLPLGLPAAVKAIREITDRPIIYDHQKAGPDMADMSGPFTEIARNAGVDGLVLFPVSGPTSTRAFAGDAIKAGLVPFVGGEIPVPDYGISGGGYVADDALDRIIKHAIEIEVDHFILPANDTVKIERRTQAIAEEVHAPWIVLTGFGALGGKFPDAFRAASAIERRFAVVGRAITLDANPADAARRIVDNIQSAIG